MGIQLHYTMAIKEEKMSKQTEKKEFYFREGCFITELYNTVHDQVCSVAQARVLPGTTTRWHSLDGIIERYLILKGQGEVEIGDTPPQSVKTGDTTVIPAGVRQRIRNTGKEDLLFLAVCTPRFAEDKYTDLEQ